MASDIDKIWFKENIGALEDQYQGKFIAILDKKVIAHSDNFNEISEILNDLKNSGKITGVPILVRASKKNPAAIKIPSI